MNLWLIAIGLGIYLLLPKKSEPAAVTGAGLSLPFKPAMQQPPEVEAFAKLLEVKQHLIEKGVPVAEVEAAFAPMMSHLHKEVA